MTITKELQCENLLDNLEVTYVSFFFLFVFVIYLLDLIFMTEIQMITLTKLIIFTVTLGLPEGRKSPETWGPTCCIALPPPSPGHSMYSFDELVRIFV
jgi:hypothetical protein